jgi:diguanylate cyclase (GGDEF)-like protein
MKLNSTLWKSHFGRRIFVVFLVAAILPMIVLSLLAVRQINSLSSQQIITTLKQDAKLYGLSLYDRLLVIEDELNFYSSLMANRILQDVAVLEQQGYIQSLMLVRNKKQIDTLFGESFEIPRTNPAQSKRIDAGKVLLLTIKGQHDEHDLIMLRQVPTSYWGDVLVAAKINEEKFWGEADVFGDLVSFCVIRDASTFYYCSSEAGRRSMKTFVSRQVERADSVSGTGRPDNEKLLGWWRLFLKARYGHPEWTVVLVRDREEAVELLRHFTGIYLVVALLVLVIVTFLSGYLLRKNLSPLEALLSGVRSISENTFTRLPRQKGSEEVGRAIDVFNEMASRIQKQISTLKSQSEIDRSILEKSSTDDIINITINGVRQLFKLDLVAIGLFVSQPPYVLHVRSRVMDVNDKFPEFDVELSFEEFNSIRHKSSTSVSASDPLFEKINFSLSSSSRSLLLIPISDADNFYGVLLVGLERELSLDDIELLREFSDRVAVAVTNAAWEDRLYEQAHSDPLTGLPNRMALEDRLEQEVQRASRHDEYLSVLFLDLDRFKNINDSLGHSVGDALLSAVAKRLLMCLRTEDMIARLGGDEFIIVISELNSQEESVTNSVTVAEKIIETLSRSFRIGKHDLKVSTSVGISIFPSDGLGTDQLLRNADSAMYHAKEQGGSNFHFYSEDLNSAAHHRIDMEFQLFKAYEQDQFVLEYQPIYDLLRDRITGAEALLRWTHPERGMIPPVEFIGIAEQIGLLTKIEEWVLDRVVEQIGALQKTGGDDFSVAMNVSSRHFHHGDLVGHVRQRLQEGGVAPSSLVIEVTESTAMKNMDKTTEILNQLSEMGVDISIDDFGTGYSSLNYLKQFPVTKLKIDRGFVKNLPDNSKDMAIVKSITTLGHNLGLLVVAEGVETRDQLDCLWSLGCDYAQGNLIGQPMPKDKLEQLIAQNDLSIRKLLD